MYQGCRQRLARQFKAGFKYKSRELVTLLELLFKRYTGPICIKGVRWYFYYGV